jgi:hypothetical protein
MHEPSFGGTDGELQSSPGGTTPRTPRCPPGTGLIAKTAIVSGPSRADGELRDDSVTVLFSSAGTTPRTPRGRRGTGEELPGLSVSWIFSSGELVGTEAAR